MFDWFKSKREKQANKVLALIERAIREVHPDRFVDPLDGSIVIQPRLVLLNGLLGKDQRERFSAVGFDDLVDRFSTFESQNLMSDATTVIGDDPVLIALATAAMHEKHNPVKTKKIRQQAQFLLDCLNAKQPAANDPDDIWTNEILKTLDKHKRHDE